MRIILSQTTPKNPLTISPKLTIHINIHLEKVSLRNDPKDLHKGNLIHMLSLRLSLGSSRDTAEVTTNQSLDCRC